MAADPQWLRSTLCEDLADFERKQGRLPDTRVIESVVNEDIRRWQADIREAKHVYKSKRATDNTHDPARRVAEKKGVTFSHSAKVEDELIKPTCQCGGICRACKLRARMLQLIEPLPWQERKPKTPMSEQCKYPKFASEVFALWAWMLMARNAKVARKKGELERIVYRRMTDIADRSNSIIGLGEWDG